MHACTTRVIQDSSLGSRIRVLSNSTLPFIQINPPQQSPSSCETQVVSQMNPQLAVQVWSQFSLISGFKLGGGGNLRAISRDVWNPPSLCSSKRIYIT